MLANSRSTVPPSRAPQDQALLRIAGRAAKLGGWIVSVPDMVTTWSEETCAIHEEAPGFSPTVEGGLAYYAAEYSQQVRKVFAACVTQGIPFDMELQIITAKGRRIWTRIIGEAVRDADGAIMLVQGACQDISDQKLAAEQIQSLGLRLQDTLETLADSFCMLDRDWVFTYLNSQAECLLQRPRADLIGQNIWQQFPSALGSEMYEACHRAMKGGHPAKFEQFSGPLERWVGGEVHPTREGVAVYFRDVTERRAAADEQLARLEHRYRGLLEAAPDAMVVVNEAGAIVLLNLQAEKQFGYDRNELLGQHVTNIIPHGFAERLIADGTRTAAESLAQQIGTGIELIARRKNGTEFPIELMLSPLQNADGILVTAAIRNISVRKAAERQLAEVQSRKRGLLEAAPDAMLLLNAEGEIVLVNKQAEKHFGYRRDELMSRQLRVLIPDVWTMIPDVKRNIVASLRAVGHIIAPEISAGDDFTPAVKESLTTALRAAPKHGVDTLGAPRELTGRRKDDSEFPVEITLSILHDADTLLIAVAIRDISLRKRTEAKLLATLAELKRSNEELSQFAYLASHDLQEPLRMVASYTQLLSKRYKGRLDADADEFIAFAVDGANRMQRLIQDLLAYSRVGTNARPLHDISTEDALDLSIMNLRAAIEASGAILTRDSLPNVVADPEQLVQLLQNLVANAIKYQRPGVPRIHVSSSRANALSPWIFSVSDNGLGIEACYFEKVFGMFQRLHKREEFEGTGIGLAICKKIAERHGGRIFVESQVGKGSTFFFTLEASRTEKAAPAPA